jgi:DNA-directed RNA polymerase specialized sigma24 family protein
VVQAPSSLSKNIGKYERGAGSFKSWLLHTTRWRIADQFRKRDLAAQGRAPRGRDETGDATPTIERVAGPDAVESIWDGEWKRNVFQAALERVKKKVSARQFQIFDCCVNKRWGASRVATELRVNIAQVYRETPRRRVDEGSRGVGRANQARTLGALRKAGSLILDGARWRKQRSSLCSR